MDARSNGHPQHSAVLLDSLPCQLQRPTTKTFVEVICTIWVDHQARTAFNNPRADPRLRKDSHGPKHTEKQTENRWFLA